MSWHRHPGVRSGGELSRGERAADRMRNSMGSWGFVFVALALLAVWMLVNLLLSCVAALQGAILLIAAKRSDQVSSELAQHDYEADCQSREMLRTLTAEFAALRRQHADQSAMLATLTGRTTDIPEGTYYTDAGG
jgi:uncharacterized membrane protein